MRNRMAWIGISRQQIRVAISAILGIVAVFAGAGCETRGDKFVWEGDYKIGEWGDRLGGVDVAFYRSTTGRYLGVSQIILDWYRSYRVDHDVPSAAQLTLWDVRRYCTSPHEGERNLCNKATDPNAEWEDFHEALVAVAAVSGRCLTVSFRDGQNWTFREPDHSLCVIG